MNILGTDSSKLNEVVFENRNKNYGAYMIRSEYNESIRKALTLLGSFVLLLYLVVYMYNKNSSSSIQQPNTILADDLKSKDLVYEYTIEPLKPEQPHQPQQNTAAAAAPGGGTPIIRDDATTTATINTNNPVNGQGTNEDTGTSSTSTLTGVPSTSVTENNNTTTETGPVYIAEEMPEFEGGVAGLMKYVAQNISYPELAKQIGKEGTVHVSFVVNEKGEVEATKIVRGIGYGCDEEVMRVISSMPKWKKVGKNSGHPVKVRFNIPVSFKLR